MIMQYITFITYNIGFLLLCITPNVFSATSANTENTETTSLQRKIIIKGDRLFPPYEFINDHGEPDGFNVELIRAIMKEVGISYELSLEYWPEVLEEFQKGKVDLITGIMYSNRRAQHFKFGAIHSFIYQNTVFRKGSLPISRLKELEGLQVVVQRGDITQEKLEEEMPHLHLVVVSDMNEGLRLVSEGKYDVAICNQEIAQSIIYKQGFSNLDMSELNLPPDEFCFASNNDSLLTVVDNAFYRLQKNGEYDRIFNKWFSISAQKGISQWLYLSLGILILTVLISYLFIILLRRQVKKANNELKQENQKLSLAIKGSNIAFWEYNNQSKVFKAYNDPINDYNENHILTLEDYHQCFEDTNPMTIKPYIELMQEGHEQSYSLDVKVKTQNDTDWHYCTITGTPFEKDPLTGRVIKYVGFRQDNTETIKLNREMDEYMRKMRYVLYHSNILIWDYTIATQTIKLDYGDESLQKTISTERFLKERIIPAKQEEVKQFLNSLNEGLKENFSEQWELLPLQGSKESEIRYAIINGMAIRDASGKIIAYSGLRKDVTDLIRTQHRLEYETERALQSDKLKSAFLANMSHEIRTPLNAIVGFSGLLQEEVEPKARAEYIQIINANNELLLNLINDILDLSRIESGEVTQYREDFDLATYFASLTASLQQRSKNPEVQFIIDNPYIKCEVHLDRNRLAQICTNFTTNSIKHTQKGFIKIGYVYIDGGIRLYTKDTGDGIPTEKQHLVFQRFEKLNPFVQGTGLGLSICKAIVDACGGKIGFISQDGEGSEFWAWFPCEAEIQKKEI